MTIRAADDGDLEELVALLDRAFSWPHPPGLDFRALLPHLLHPGRIGDHLIGVEQGRITAIVGVYEYELVLDGVALRGAAIGQVATAPELRGGGRMRAMLDAAIERIDARALDLAWLNGDRRRYGHHGWALGGCTVHHTLGANTLPAPPDPSAVVRMHPDDLIETLIGHSQRLRTALRCPVSELALLARARGYGGVRLGDAWVIHGSRGDRVFFGDGEVDALGRLFAHLITHTPVRAGQAPAILVEIADEPTALDRACRHFHRSVQRSPSCMWRIGKLVGLLTRAAQMAAARIGAGSDILSLIHADTGEAATIECRDGQVVVRSGVEAPAHVLGPLALSELCFGHGSIERMLPSLRANSPLHQVLPIRAHVSGFFPS